MSMKEWITDALTRELKPVRLSVEDESHLHAGHAGSRPGGETHFRIDVVSDAFAGRSRVDRHRIVNAAVADAFSRQGLHALAIKARSPDE